jgi:ubiquinone/menaquinone biosynthesis C-methylase UbiE
MSYANNPSNEQPSTYFVQDRSNEDELNRLQLQDQMVTASMGDLLPEQTEVASLRRVLDVGCGTGGWLIQVAKAYPDISLLIGVDVSERMIQYARNQARLQEVAHRVEFHTMDALRMLEFPANYFDLVNQRFGHSYLRTWDWPNLLQEYQRVTRPGGVIRITEANIVTDNTSPALTTLSQLFLEAFYHAGHLFSPESKGITSELARMLTRYGIQNVQTRAYALDYQAGTPEGERYYENTRLSETLLPFIRKWTHIPDNYAELRQQALIDMRQPDFSATMTLLTAWGTKSE